jgi:hypothetical protein
VYNLLCQQVLLVNGNLSILNFYDFKGNGTSVQVCKCASVQVSVQLAGLKTTIAN